MLPQNINPTIKYGREGINFWGCFSAAGMGIFTKIEGNLNGIKYANIIENELCQSFSQMNISKEEGLLVQDKDPKHQSAVA